MNSKNKKIPTPFVLKLCSMALLLVFVLWKIDYGVFWRTIYSSNLLLVLMPVLLFLPSQMLGAFRWQFVLKRLGCHLSFWSIMRYSILGQFTSLFLPGQISGDIVRTIAITKGQEEKSAFVMSVVIDKLSILIAISLFAIIGIISSAILVKFSVVGLMGFALLMSTCVIFVALCRYRGGLILKCTHRVNAMLPSSFGRRLLLICEGNPVSKIPFPSMIAILVLAVVSQLVNTIGMAVLAYGMNIIINSVDWVAINAIVSVVQMIPISIGGLGVREGTFAGILSLYAVPTAQSTAYSLVGFALLAILLFCSWIILDAGYSYNKWFILLRGLNKPEAR